MSNTDPNKHTIDASKVTFSARTWVTMILLAITHTVTVMAYITNDSRAKDLKLKEQEGVLNLHAEGIRTNAKAIEQNQAAIQKSLDAQVARTDDLTKSIQNLTVEIAKMGKDPARR